MLRVFEASWKAGHPFAFSMSRALALAFVVLFLAGCRDQLPEEEQPDENTNGSCEKPVEKHYSPEMIKGGHHLYFGSDTLELIGENSFRPTSINLKVTLKEKKKSAGKDLVVGMNGFFLVRVDGKRGFDGEDPADPNKNFLHLEKMRLNGAVKVTTFLKYLKKNGGTPRVSLVGKDLHVKKAVLEIIGTEAEACPDPNPTPEPSPTPPPVAPKLNLDELSPRESLTNQTAIRFSFSADQDNVSFSCRLDNGASELCVSPMSYSQLASGHHSFEVTATNHHGLKSEVVQHQWTIDAIAPVVSIDPIAPLSSSKLQRLTFSSDKQGIFHCSVDGGQSFPCVSPLDLKDLSEGSHSFEVSMIDGLGNVSQANRVEWRVDTIAPSVSIVSTEPAASPSSLSTRVFNFVADESATFECSLDGAAFSACASPWTLDQLSEDLHRFQIRAIDAAGNIGLGTLTSWSNDYTPPTLIMDAVTPRPGPTNAEMAILEFNSSEAGHFLCQFDGEAEAECSSPTQKAFGEDGVHSARIVAVDLAGLRSSAFTATWIVDRKAPALSFSQILPSASATTNAKQMEFHVGAGEDVSLTASFDGVSLGPVTSPIVLTNLTEGTHRLVVSGVDGFGNQTGAITHSFTTDLTTPTFSLRSDLEGAAVVSRAYAGFTFSASEDSRFECELDGAGFSACASPWDLSGLIDGEHRFKAKAIDRAGNESTVSQISWRIDTEAPTTTGSAMQLSRNSFRFLFSASESSASFTCSLDGSLLGGCRTPIDVWNLSPGRHTMVIRAVDRIGNIDPVGAVFEVFVEDTIKTVLKNPGVVFTNQNSITFTFSASHTEATFLCSLDNTNPKPCLSPVTYSGLSDGSHSFKVYAVDRWGDYDPVGASHTWTVDRKSPVIVMSGASSTDTSITVTWTTNEPATSQLDWGLGTELKNSIGETNEFKTTHSFQITGLLPNTVYSIQMSGRDRTGNIYLRPKQQVRTRF